MSTPRYIDSVTNPRISGFEWQEPQDEYDVEWYQGILNSAGTIFYNDPRKGLPAQSYSVGFYINFLQPEILVVGLSQPVAHRGIEKIRDELEVGRFLKAGDERSDIFDLKFPVQFVSVPERYYFSYLDYAAWFYRSLLFKVKPIGEHKFPVLQAIWADKNGFYPDDPRCDENARRVQTLVELP